jgi:hypothetical protein
MNMNRNQRFLTGIVVICSLFAITGFAVAAAKAHHHHDGKQLLGANSKKDGRHVIDKKGHYTTAVDTKGGKVADVHVVHDTKGEIPVKKYKTNKKLAQVDGGHVVYASFLLGQDQDMGTVYIGYAYTDDYGNEEIYWFPYDEVLDPDTGAVDYIPES